MNNKLKENSIKIDDNSWYYEEKKGVCVVHEVRDKTAQLIRNDRLYFLTIGLIIGIVIGRIWGW